MFSRRVWWMAFALAALFLMRTANASADDEKRFELGPFGGWTRYDRELREPNPPMLKDAVNYGARARMRMFGSVWLDLAGGVSNSETLGVANKWQDFSANLMLAPMSSHAISPFVSAGMGFSQFRPQHTPDKTDGTFEVAGGLRIRLAPMLALRLEARNVLLMPKKEWGKAHIDNMIFGAGLMFGFGGKPRDSDGDGVPDKLDLCASTPVGCRVDVQGCPIDADKDGVCDGIDQCPDTPRGAKVDARGCPMDSDGDGVYDGIDKCPNTPKGVKVDASGCPIDSDGDGVPDGIDQCADTRKGCTVDAKGCPIDSDGDGVCDGLDKCPNTPAGARIDVDGCPVRTEVEIRETELLDTGMIRLQDVHFQTAKAVILPESFANLDVIGQVLAKWPQLRIEIGGHCDSRGSDAYNMALSQRRANSILAYLKMHFPALRGSQMTTKGYGESVPLQPNTSPENMAQNRRVEFVVLNKEVLKQLKH